MSLLRRLLGRPARVEADAAPADLLDYLQDRRSAAEARLLRKYPACTVCGSADLRVGAWSRGGQAGWTLTCTNCGQLLEQTTEVKAG